MDREIDGASMLTHLLEGSIIEREKPLYWQYEYPECYEVAGEGYDSRFDGARPENHTYRPSVSVRSGQYVLRGIFREKFKLPEEYMLFDVVNDPNEQHELSEENPELFEELKSSLQKIYISANADRSKHL